MNVRRQFSVMTAMAPIMIMLYSPLPLSSDPLTPQAVGPVEQVATGFKFAEGPASDRDGVVYFTDSHHGEVYRWTAERGLSMYYENHILTVGLDVDGAGMVLACEDNMILDSSGEFSMYDGPCRRLVAIGPDSTKRAIADSYGGKRLNGLNDIWVAPNGAVYLTDPDWGRPGMEQGTGQVLRLSPDRSRLDRIIDDIPIPNGITGSPDGTVLYVIDSEMRRVFACDILPDGSVTGKRLFAAHGYDGMTVDEHGNVYVTAGEPRRGIVIYTPSGDVIGSIDVPEQPSNLCFGGPGHTTLFITAAKSLYAVPMNVRGVPD